MKILFPSSLRHSLLLAAIFAGLQTVHAQDIISGNFVGSGNPMLPTDSAGVVPATNYNNLPGNNVTSAALVDNSGAATTMTASSHGQAGGSATGLFGISNTPAGGDETLNSGGLITDVGGNATFTLNNIPYASYSLYVYFLAPAAGLDTTIFSSSGAAFYANTPTGTDINHVDGNSATTYQYLQATGTSAHPTNFADYAVFTNLSGPSQVVAFQMGTTNSAQEGGVTGFQVVNAVPEPSSVALLGVAGVFGLCFAVRKRSAKRSAA